MWPFRRKTKKGLSWSPFLELHDERQYIAYPGKRSSLTLTLKNDGSSRTLEFTDDWTAHRSNRVRVTSTPEAPDEMVDALVEKMQATETDLLGELREIVKADLKRADR